MTLISKGEKQSWSIIIICYNEVGSIVRVNNDVQSVLAKIANNKREVIIVDDGSSDGSVEAIKKIDKKYKNVKSVFHKTNLGIGEAICSGYRTAQYENVCVVPADGQFDLKELRNFSRIEKNMFVSFYREKQVGYSFFRSFISKVNYWVNRIFLGIYLKDVNWVKIFKKEEIEKLDLRLKSSLVATEICAKLLINENNIIESPSVYHLRKAGEAKAGSFKTVWGALTDTFHLICVVWDYKRHRKIKNQISPNTK
jgi:glycosyltransferase involved in cell wall biosynthesis